MQFAEYYGTYRESSSGADEGKQTTNRHSKVIRSSIPLSYCPCVGLVAMFVA